jgi:hypothetical protein
MAEPVDVPVTIRNRLRGVCVELPETREVAGRPRTHR